MDTLENYQKIIENTLTEYVKIPYINRQLETKLIIDKCDRTPDSTRIVKRSLCR